MKLIIDLIIICVLHPLAIAFNLEPLRSSQINKSEGNFNCLQWTPWFNGDSSNLRGDWETISSPENMGVPGTLNHYMMKRHICTIPVSIECRSRLDGISWVDSYDDLALPCIANQGLICQTQDQEDGRICKDYEVRFLCWKPCQNFRWSNWLDVDDPEGEGDIEILGETISREMWPCEGGEVPVDVQCETLTGIPAHQSKKRGLRCFNLGFSCLNLLQNPDCPCNDFKVRFLCPIARQFPTGYAP